MIAPPDPGLVIGPGTLLGCNGRTVQVVVTLNTSAMPAELLRLVHEGLTKSGRAPVVVVKLRQPAGGAADALRYICPEGAITVELLCFVNTDEGTEWVNAAAWAAVQAVSVGESAARSDELAPSQAAAIWELVHQALQGGVLV
jgi:hypothetical protein